VCIYTSPTSICESRPFADTPLCQHHLGEIILQGVEGGIGDLLFGELGQAFRAHLDETAPERTARVEAAAEARRGAATSFVYYLRIYDSVKIGHTVNVRRRVGELRVDMAGLLAVEPGGADLERERHLQFAQHRLGRRENFVPVPALMAHIAALREAHGDLLDALVSAVPQRVLDKGHACHVQCDQSRCGVGEGRSS
jgi:hypothetical protein